ncbi:MAG: TonB-dependent receptor domain-containing protein [Gammaproteobacteria bacterium]
MPALAQDPSADIKSGTEFGPIVVTGSRIRRETLSDAPSPTLQVGQEEIAERQMANVITALDELNLGTVTTNRGANTQFGDNYAFVGLLNVGTQRTLTLLNGRRVVPSNQGTVFVPGNASGAQVDFTLFNPLMVERIEVITGTGGAVYGADAVAGVVNVITRKDFEGLSVQAGGGIAEFDDETSYRASAVWGTNLFDDRLNFTLAGEYYESDILLTSDRNPARYQGAPSLNQFNGAVRDPNSFSPSQAVADLIAGRALNPVFRSATTDQVASTVFNNPLSLQTPAVSTGGLLVGGQFATLGATTQFFPSGFVAAGFGAAADPQGLAFFAPSALTAAQNTNPNGSVIQVLSPGLDVSGLTLAQQRTLALQMLQRARPTPWEHGQTNAVNPLHYVAAFGGGGMYPTINNTDPATSALFPRVAVPLHFDSSGNLVPFNIGDITPPNQGRINAAFGGDGYDSFAAGHQQTRSGVERASFMGQHRLDISDNVRWIGEYMYSDMTFDSIATTQQNGPFGSTTAGTRSIPIFIDQNPFLNASSLATINGLVPQGLAIPTIGGQRVLFMGRALTDVMGGGTETSNEVKTWRIGQTLEGDFEAWGRPFYWDISGARGEAEAVNRNAQLLDLEFALAVDVVQGPNGPVCRQQTLAAPESVAIRNPQLAFINTLLSLTPTAAQVAACVPLDLFGSGAPSQEAINYVRTDGGTTNNNEQDYYAASLGAEVFDLPGGPLGLNIQTEYRKESIAFVPGAAASVGAARNTTIRANSGELEFTEYGVEARIPVFGGDFTFPLLRAMELDYAFRRVEREQSTESIFYPDPGEPTEDDIFSAGIRWKPFDDLTLRGTFAESVRSASLVELFSAPSSGFTNPVSGANYCRNTQIDSGPNPTVRRANCVAAVQTLGLAATPAEATAFLSTFTGTGGARPAAATGNPFLQNEQGRSWTVGFTWQPNFVPNLSVGLDYIDLEIKQEIGLYFPDFYIQNCFDSTDFPNTIVAGTPVCDLYTFGIQDASGQWIIPATNPLTGNPVTGGAAAGSPATVQGPFETAFMQFPNFNLGRREVQAYNFEARYGFELGAIADAMDNWGSIFLRGSAFFTDALDLYANGVDLSDKQAGEPAAPSWRTRLDVTHRVGNLAHTLQWFYVDTTVDDILLPVDRRPDQSQAFINADYNFFNYNAQYSVSDNIEIRLTVNNLTDEDGPNGAFGDAYDLGVGREYVLGVSWRVR